MLDNMLDNMNNMLNNILMMTPSAKQMEEPEQQMMMLRILTH